MNNLKVIGLFNDMNLSLKVASLCNLYELDLLFPNYKQNFYFLNNIRIAILIIDIDNKQFGSILEKKILQHKIKAIKIGYMKKINNDIKNKNKTNYDIILDKETLIRNLEIIFKQIIKETIEVKN